jgi:glycosyltransferase involved in cell wall biosynthesis
MHSSLPQQLANFQFTKSRLLTRLFEVLENAALRSATAVITICPDLADIVRPRIENPSSHFLIENSIFEEVGLSGIPSGASDLTGMPAMPAPPVVVYTGTFEAYQGIDLLIDAFTTVHAQRSDASLVLVGGTPAQVAHYRALADARGLNGSCTFTGRVPPATAKCLTRRASVLTSPRVLGTNTPLKIYEQLASGIPIVATRIHSHTQVLDDEVCFLVEPTPESMATGILDALSDGSRAESVTRNALALYESRYSRPVYEGKMRSLLQLLS